MYRHYKTLVAAAALNLVSFSASAIKLPPTRNPHIELTRQDDTELISADDERVKLLLEDYAFFVSDPELFCERLDALVTLRGRDVVEGWQAQVRAGDVEPVVRELLFRHYDPGYAASIERNFVQYGTAQTIAPSDRSAVAMSALAREIRAGEAAAAAG